MNNDYNAKQTLINNLSFLDQYKDTHSLYFVTITFKLPKRSIDGVTYKKENFDEYFRLFKNRLNKLALRHSKQRNKCAFIAFPEESHYTHKSLNQEEIINLNQNRQLATFSGHELPQHYHCVVMVHNQHKERFEKRATIKAVGYKKKLSSKLHNPYPKSLFAQPQNLIVQDTDIQSIDSIDGVIGYSTKNLLFSNFHYDDIYIFVSKNSMGVK